MSRRRLPPHTSPSLCLLLFPLSLVVVAFPACAATAGAPWSGEASAPQLAECYLDAATAALPNLARAALGAIVTATYERNAVAKLLDDDANTGYDAPFEREQVSLTLTWSVAQSFDCVYWERTRGLGPDARELRDADLSVSPDGVEWTKVREIRGFSGQFDYVRFPAVTAKALRLDVLKTSGGQGVVIWDLKVLQVGETRPVGWWDPRWTWRACLGEVTIPGSGPHCVSARLDLAAMATRWGKTVVLDSLRVVERRAPGEAAGSALPAMFAPGEGLDRPGNQNGTLRWIAPPAPSDQRRFDVYFAFGDDPPTPPAPAGLAGHRFETAGEGKVRFLPQPGAPPAESLKDLTVYDDYNQPSRTLAEPGDSGTIAGLETGVNYWVAAETAEGGYLGATWLPQAASAPGTLKISLPRFVWARGETLPVTATLPPGSPATRVELSLAWRGQKVGPGATTRLESVGQNREGKAVLPTASLAQGAYRLTAVARGPQGVVDVRTLTVSMVQPREAPFAYGNYCWPSLPNASAEGDWRMMADLGNRLTLKRDADAALRYRMRVIPKLQNAEHSIQPSLDASWIAHSSDGQPLAHAVSYLAPELRESYRNDLLNTLRNYRGHPGFSGVIFWHDDGQLQNRWVAVEGQKGKWHWYPQDYSARTVADFQAKAGAQPPTPQETPKRTGVVPDNDLWLRWLTHRCDDYYAGLTRYLMKEKAAVDPRAALIEVHGGGGANPYVALSDGLYPPYDQAACDWVGSYFYPGSFWPTLDYLWQIQVGWMGNRGRPSWMTTGLHTNWAPLAIRNKFHMVLAAGYDSLIHFIYDPDLWEDRD